MGHLRVAIDFTILKYELQNTALIHILKYNTSSACNICTSTTFHSVR